VLEAPVHVVLAAWLMALAFKVLASFVPEVGVLLTSFCNNWVIWSPCLLSHWVGLGKIPDETSDGEPGGVASDERRGVDPAALADGGCLLGDVRPEPAGPPPPMYLLLVQSLAGPLRSASSADCFSLTQCLHRNEELPEFSTHSVSLSQASWAAWRHLSQ